MSSITFKSFLPCFYPSSSQAPINNDKNEGPDEQIAKPSSHFASNTRINEETGLEEESCCCCWIATGGLKQSRISQRNP